MLKIIHNYLLLLFLGVVGYAQVPVQESQVFINNKGANNLTNHTINLPQNKLNRVLIVQVWMERFMGTNSGDNWPVNGLTSSNQNVVTNMPNISLTYGANSSQMVKSAPNYEAYQETNTGDPIGNADLGWGLLTYYYIIPNSVTDNTITVNFSGIKNPMRSQDEIIATIELYSNVGSKTTYSNNGGGYFNNNGNRSNSSGPTTSSSFDFVYRNTPTAPTGTNFSQILYVGALMSSNEDNGLKFADSGWDALNKRLTVVNNNGTMTGVTSTGPTDEHNGITLISSARTFATAPTGNYTVSRTGNSRIGIVRSRLTALLPLAKPAYSGQVVLDTDGATNINGTGSNAGASFVNVVDSNGLIVFSAPIAADGSFTIPQGNITEANKYSFILATTSIATTPSLNSGYTFVGESSATTGNDGTADGILGLTVLADAVSNLRFGVNKSIVTLNAQNDINQTEINKQINGNLLTNDNSSNGTKNLQSATYLDANGSVQNLPTNGTSTTIYDKNKIAAGVISLNSDGTYVFTPANNFIGTVPITYTVNNGAGISDSANLSIEVIDNINKAVNNKPIAHDDSSGTKVNTPVSGNVLSNDIDLDGNTLTINSASSNGTAIPVGTATQVSGVDSNGNPVANAGTLTLNSNGTYTFTPATGFTGKVNPIGYTVSDSKGGSDSANIYITVNPNTGNMTYANDDANLGPRGTIIKGNVLTNDTDPEGNSQTVTSATVNGVPMVIGTSTTLTDIGRVIVNADGSYAFSPLQPYTNYRGTITVVYTKCDNGNPQACDTATLYITALNSISRCYKPANTSGATIDTNVGISTIGKGTDWPQNRKGAFLAIESKTKGLVLSRMTTNEINSISNPQIGMAVYDTVLDCLKVYGKGPNSMTPIWLCYREPACNE